MERADNPMTYDRQNAIATLRQACIEDDPAILRRAVVLEDVLKSVAMDDGSIDHATTDVVYITVAPSTPGGRRRAFQWHSAKPLDEQPDETMRLLIGLLKKSA
jgi:hypothetical protein